MHEYEAAKLVTSPNEPIHSTHQRSAIYTTTHLAQPISAAHSLLLAQSGLFSTHETARACIPPLASDRYERRASNKRAREDLLLQDAFECKRRPCLLPGLAAVNATNVYSVLEGLEKPSPRKLAEMGGSLKISNVCYQNAGGFRAEELNHKVGHVPTIGIDDKRTENMTLILQENSTKSVLTHLQQARKSSHDDEKTLEVGSHNHPRSNFRNDGVDESPLVFQAVIHNRGNRRNKCMSLHACRISSDIKGQQMSADIPCFLPTGPVDKKTLASQEGNNVSLEPAQAQQGKQSFASFSKPNSKVLVDVTNRFQVTATADAKKCLEEDDTHRLSQRHKQIEYGKNTLGYERYHELIPKLKRKGKDPKTPNPKQVCSKRSWDGQIRKWRRLLHDYDPPTEEGEELAEDMTLLKSKQKNAKPELGKDDNDPKILSRELFSRPQEITAAGTTGGVATEDAGLSIYDDWMDC